MTQAFLWTIAILGVGGIALLLAGRWLPARWSAWASLGLLAVALLPFLLLRAGPLEVRLFSWIPADEGPIGIAYRFDTLSRAFALLAGLSAVPLLLWMALGAPAEEGHYAPWLLFLLALFLNLLGSADLLQAYASWEGLILATYLLLVYRRSSLPTPGIAEWFLGGQHLAGYALLAALLLVIRPAGTLHYGLLNPGAVAPAALLLLLGTTWVRMAQVPFQGWALAVAESPGPVSTMLLGGGGLLAGPYIWLRFLSRVSAHTPREVALVAGSISLVVGAALALRQESGRQVQAGDTASRLGLLWIALGLDGPLGVAASLFLLLDFVWGKVLFHIALSGGGRLNRPVRQALFAFGVWGAAGLPPSAGFVGRWLLVLGLFQAGRPAYLPIVLLATPLMLSYLWRGWTLLPLAGAGDKPRPAAAQGVVVGWAALLPLSGAAAPGLWRLLLERSSMAVLGIDVLAVRAPMGTLEAWIPVWGLVLLLIGAGWAWWSGALRRRGARPKQALAAVKGPLQEPLLALPGETAWLAWVGRPAPLYRFFGRLLGRLAGGLQRTVTSLERHTTYFLLFVLVAAGAVLIFLTR